jgi:hypothetical protein
MFTFSITEINLHQWHQVTQARASFHCTDTTSRGGRVVSGGASQLKGCKFAAGSYQDFKLDSLPVCGLRHTRTWSGERMHVHTRTYTCTHTLRQCQIPSVRRPTGRQPCLAIVQPQGVGTKNFLSNYSYVHQGAF